VRGGVVARHDRDFLHLVHVAFLVAAVVSHSIHRHLNPVCGKTAVCTVWTPPMLCTVGKVTKIVRPLRAVAHPGRFLETLGRERCNFAAGFDQPARTAGRDL
jgi:hypothetical protein